MKRILVILALMTMGATAFAQNDALFTFSNTGQPKDVTTLGHDPEFPFLKDMATSHQAYMAIKRNADKGSPEMTEFNNILMAIGFTNGAKDVEASNVTSANLPSGTMGNMGDGTLTSSYAKLDLGDDGTRAWKVTGTEGYVYFLQKCGNAFFPNKNATGRTACVTTPVNVTSQPVEITAGGQKNEITQKTFVYYHMRRHSKHPRYEMAAIAGRNPSKPLLLSTTKKVGLVPETYKVTVAGQDQDITVCPDSTASVNANINVEKTSSYAGYFPNNTDNQYRLVSRREYMRAERKMRKAERKEEKVARITKTQVNVEEDVAKS